MLNIYQIYVLCIKYILCLSLDVFQWNTQDFSEHTFVEHIWAIDSDNHD